MHRNQVSLSHLPSLRRTQVGLFARRIACTPGDCVEILTLRAMEQLSGFRQVHRSLSCQCLNVKNHTCLLYLDRTLFFFFDLCHRTKILSPTMARIRLHRSWGNIEGDRSADTRAMRGCDGLAAAVQDELAAEARPSWCAAMPFDAQSYLVLDWLPQALHNKQMTLDYLSLAKPAATPSAVPTSTSSITTTQASEPPSVTMESSAHSSDQKSSRETAIIAGTIVPIFSPIFGILLALWLMKRRREKQRGHPTSIPCSFDPEQATQRWSQTTFSTTSMPGTQTRQP